MSIAKGFGAAGDGRVDDTAALQHAVDDGDGVLELTKGTYRITKPIVLDTTKHGYLGVRGDQGTARVVMDGPGPAFFVVGDHQGTAHPDSVKPHTWDRERLPILSGFEIVGAHAEADGIRLLRTMKTLIRNVAVRECRYGIHLVERNRNFILAESHLYRCSDTGLFFDRVNLHQANVVGSHISYNRRAGIRQLDGDVHNIQITGNDIEYNYLAEEGLSGEIVLEAPNGITSEYTIVSNTIQARPVSKDANIVIVGKEEDPPSSARVMTITGNVIGHRDKCIDIRNGQRIVISGNTMYGGTTLSTRLRNCIHVTVSGNTIASRPYGHDDKARDGLVLEGCVGCAVTGNVMNNSRYGDATAGGCVTLRDCRDTSVASCQILDPQFRGVHLHNTVRCTVTGNTIADRGEKRQMVAAVDVTGTGSNNVVQSNAVSQGTKAAISCDPARGAVLHNTVWA